MACILGSTVFSASLSVTGCGLSTTITLMSAPVRTEACPSSSAPVGEASLMRPRATSDGTPGEASDGDSSGSVDCGLLP